MHFAALSSLACFRPKLQKTKTPETSKQTNKHKQASILIFYFFFKEDSMLGAPRFHKPPKDTNTKVEAPALYLKGLQRPSEVHPQHLRMPIASSLVWLLSVLCPFSPQETHSRAWGTSDRLTKNHRPKRKSCSPSCAAHVLPGGEHRSRNSRSSPRPPAGVMVWQKAAT